MRKYSRIFHSTCSRSESQLILIPVPWEVTVSYGGGASRGPQTIVQASEQLDYWDFEFGDIRQKGIYWDGPQKEIRSKNQKYKKIAQNLINNLYEYEDPNESELYEEDLHTQDQQIKDLVATVNQACGELNQWLYEKTLQAMSENKIAGVVGGDHSCPLGSMRAHCEQFSDLGVLHIDAHADLRKEYQGFKFSHASIMRNLMELPTPPSVLVQVGVRDFCKAEWCYIHDHKDIKCFFDRELKNQLLSGTHWSQLCQRIIDELPDRVYVSLDIDGLHPSLCPHTGTPVPGGLSYDQVVFLLSFLRKSSKKVVGFDLCEVAPDSSGEWDGNVGARVLYQLCGLTLTSF